MLSTRLFGGHRNQVFRIDGRVKIVWTEGFARRAQIREGVLLENFVASHTDIKARMLVDKSKPVQEEDGKLVTYFHYVDGEIRYPWTIDEITSAGKLLTRLHSAFPKVRPFDSGRSDLLRRLHLDFARGNVLFEPGAPTAIGVIDFENTLMGTVEQELGRTLSFLLVDSPGGNISDLRSKNSYAEEMKKRKATLLTNYGLPYRRDRVIKWIKKYLQQEDYGTLNAERDLAVEWLRMFHSSIMNHKS